MDSLSGKLKTRVRIPPSVQNMHQYPRGVSNSLSVIGDENVGSIPMWCTNEDVAPLFPKEYGCNCMEDVGWNPIILSNFMGCSTGVA